MNRRFSSSSQKMPASLREGFTTGSAATAATMAALRVLCGEAAPATVAIPLPPDARSSDCLTIPIVSVERLDAATAMAAVIKDGGDDPDATHNARIEALVTSRLTHESEECFISIEGGEGVGRATLPGLPVSVGEAAINPGPRAQIARAVREYCAARALGGHVAIIIRVPEGERIARQTLNPRLGILGGISILGTQGTVRPFSHDAWRHTILQGLDVAKAIGCSSVAFSSGRRSERLLTGVYAWPEQAFIQAADFIGFAVREARLRGFTTLVWGGFFGKLLKIAEGHECTHAKTTAINFEFLADLCIRHNLSPAVCGAVRQANTAAQALTLILDDTAAPAILNDLARRACDTLAALAAESGSEPAITIHLFSLDGSELIRMQHEPGHCLRH